MDMASYITLCYFICFWPHLFYI